MKPLNIIILGPSGSGKGTQAKLLAKKFNLEYLESGAIFRKIAQQNTSLGKKVKRIMSEQGKFIPYQIMIKIAEKTIKKVPKKKGIVFDGFGRKLPEIKANEKFLAEQGRKLNYAFLIEVNDKEILNRLSKRRICRDCKSIFISGKTIKKGAKKCPKCGGEVYRREDDTPTKIKSRLNEYQKETLPVICYLDKKGILIKINGEQPIKKVYQDIVSKISKFKNLNDEIYIKNKKNRKCVRNNRKKQKRV